MSDHERLDKDEARAARITAHALGELDSDERSEMESRLAEDSESRRVFDETQRVAEALASGDAAPELPQVSEDLRDAVLKRLELVKLADQKDASAANQGRRRWAISLLAAAACLTLIVLPLRFIMMRQAGPGHEPVVLLGNRTEESQVVEGAVVVEETVLGEPIAELYSQIPPTAEFADAAEKEVARLREEIRLAEQERDAKFSAVVAETGSMSRLQQEAELAEKYEALSKEVEKALAVRSDLSIVPKERGKVTTWSAPAAPQSVGLVPARPAPNTTTYSAESKWGDKSAGIVAGGAGGMPADSGAMMGGAGYGAPAQPAGSEQAGMMGMADGSVSMGSLSGMPGGAGEMTTRDAGSTIPEGEVPGLRERLIRDHARMALGTEQYAPIVENQFVPVANNPLSTFSIDVDTASYANVRRFLTQNQLPPANAVRIEELVNYFTYDYPAPNDKEPFSVDMEVAECPWQPTHQIVRFGLKGKEVPRKERPASNLVFLLDVSGSMQDANKLPLLKQAMKLLTNQLTENDRVTIATYASNAGLKLDTTGGHDHQTIRNAIDSLNANGSTNGSAGIQLAYEKATQAFIKEGANRVILATDGDLNVGITDDDALVKLITEKAESGVFLTVLGFGEGNLKDGKLEKLADNGNGMYAYVDSLREARKVLVEQISSSLVTIAKDVKIKVEFNPAEVAAYRLLGYENRLMTAPEFDDDKKDAGEIGAGHTVTALYEVVPAKAPRAVAAVEGKLKYQRPAEPVEPPKELTEAAQTGELLTLFLRYKQPDGNESTLREFALANKQQAFDDASLDLRFASAVASFGMLLRNSKFRGSASPATVEEIASSAIGDDAQGYRTEFLDLVRRVSALKPQGE
jgi:Ca-activated chloride channel family protein